MVKSILDNEKKFHAQRRTYAWRTWCIRKAAKEEQSKYTINPLASRNDQNINSPHNFNTYYGKQVMRKDNCIIYRGAMWMYYQILLTKIPENVQ